MPPFLDKMALTETSARNTDTTKAYTPAVNQSCDTWHLLLRVDCPSTPFMHRLNDHISTRVSSLGPSTNKNICKGKITTYLAESLRVTRLTENVVNMALGLLYSNLIDCANCSTLQTIDRANCSTLQAMGSPTAARLRIRRSCQETVYVIKTNKEEALSTLALYRHTSVAALVKSAFSDYAL